MRLLNSAAEFDQIMREFLDWRTQHDEKIAPRTASRFPPPRRAGLSQLPKIFPPANGNCTSIGQFLRINRNKSMIPRIIQCTEYFVPFDTSIANHRRFRAFFRTDNRISRRRGGSIRRRLKIFHRATIDPAGSQPCRDRFRTTDIRMLRSSDAVPRNC